MKSSSILTIVLAGSLAMALAACSKQDADKTATTVKDATAKAMDATKDATVKATEAVKDTSTKAVDATKDAANKTAEVIKDAAASASTDIVAALESAKKLVSEGKWQEAGKALEPLTKLKLTPEQQSLLDQLKKQIAQLQAGSAKLTEDAGKAVGDLLKK